MVATKNSLSVKIKKITPADARAMLEKNTNNRPISRKHVLRYMKAMQEGEFHFNGETIKFDSNGQLIDGQKRLTACVETDIPFTTVVVEGLPPAAFNSIDLGEHRKAWQMLARDGHENASQLAAALMYLSWYSNGWTRRVTPTPNSQYMVLSEHPKIKEALADACELAPRKGGVIGRSILAFMLYTTSQSDSELSKRFWRAVATGEGLKSGEPEYLLRERMIRNLASKSKMHVDEIVALCIKAWNAKKAGKPLGVLKFPRKEEFPTIA